MLVLVLLWVPHVLLLVLLLLMLPLATRPVPLIPRRGQQGSIIGTTIVALLGLMPLPRVSHQIRLHMLHMILQLMLCATVIRQLLLM